MTSGTSVRDPRTWYLIAGATLLVSLLARAYLIGFRMPLPSLLAVPLFDLAWVGLGALLVGVLLSRGVLRFRDGYAARGPFLILLALPLLSFFQVLAFKSLNDAIWDTPMAGPDGGTSIMAGADTYFHLQLALVFAWRLLAVAFAVALVREHLRAKAGETAP